MYQSRVLYSYLTTTPIAGKAFLQRLKRLIAGFGTYTPPRETHRPIRPDPKRRSTPPISTEDETGTPAATKPIPVPGDVLDWWTLEDIRSRGCFVGSVPLRQTERPDEADDLQEYAKLFSQSCGANDAAFVLHKKEMVSDSGNGTINVPGWVRERAAEVFFEAGDVDALSVVEVILSCLIAVCQLFHIVFLHRTHGFIPAPNGYAESDDIIDRGFRRSVHDARLHITTAHPAITNNSPKCHG